MGATGFFERVVLVLDRKPWAGPALGLSTFGCIVVLDLVTPEQLSFALFYLLPIALSLMSRKPWLPWLIATASTLVWPVDHAMHGDSTYFQSTVPYWQVAVWFGFYAVSIVGLAALKRYLTQLRTRNDELRAALSALHETEQRYREVFENSSSGIALFDVTPDLRFKAAAINPAVEHMTGLIAANVVGRFVDEVPLQAETARRLVRNYARCVQGGSPIVVSDTLDFPAGRLDFVTSLVPVRDSTGQIRRLITLPANMTDKNRAEQALRESEARYREIVQNTSDGIFVVEVTPDLRYRLLSYNPAQERMLGISAADVVGKFIEDYLPPGLREKASQDNRRCIEAGVPMSFEETFDISTGLRHHYTTLVPIHDQNGRIARLIGVTRDLTEMKRAEERERIHEQELFQASKLVSLGTLVAGIAHEINNPNNFIRLNAQNLKEFWQDLRLIMIEAGAVDKSLSLHGVPIETARGMIGDLLAGIEEGSKRIDKLLKNLRDFARGDDGELTEQVDVNMALESAVLMMRNLIQKSTDSFSLHQAAGLPSVRGNQHQIEQVFINLVTNACQALPSRDKKIGVTTSIERGWVSIEVADEGIGIPSEDIARVTDPFFTTKRATGGSGLGLAVTSRIVSNHGGTIGFSSQIGAGTQVNVRLPAIGNADERNSERVQPDSNGRPAD